MPNIDSFWIESFNWLAEQKVTENIFRESIPSSVLFVMNNHEKPHSSLQSFGPGSREKEVWWS